MNIKPEIIERYPAIRGNPGYFGCCKSHTNALISARDRGCKNVLMLEDDFVFTVTRNELDYYLEYLFNDFNEPWDVIMFVYNLIDAHPYKNDKVLARVLTATTGAGYLVNGHYLPTLIQNFEEAWPKLCQTCCHWLYVCDRSWATLQRKDRWFYFKKPLGKCDDKTSDDGYH
jgi:GR25 family glycosyltransferase involved in LPS biosynthesis